nr:immunoglobulin heavy chain junction region [Mus musculus]MBK4183905.1 immunoglobulin heavy chain junction region [Mus musculus]
CAPLYYSNYLYYFDYW